MRYGEDTTPDVERIAAAGVDSAYTVLVSLGPGLLESVYKVCEAHELVKRGFLIEQELPVPVLDDGINIDAGFKSDLLVNRLVVVELKAVTEMHPVYKAQLLTNLKLLHFRLGLLINFNVPLIKDGICRVLNNPL